MCGCNESARDVSWRNADQAGVRERSTRFFGFGWQRWFSRFLAAHATADLVLLRPPSALRTPLVVAITAHTFLIVTEEIGQRMLVVHVGIRDHGAVHQAHLAVRANRHRKADDVSPDGKTFPSSVLNRVGTGLGAPCSR